MIHARDLPLRLRIAAYGAVLLGYFFYCYNFNVFDYVRPYLITDLGFSLGQTAAISTLQNVGVTLGAVIWAGAVARAGRRRSAALIALAMGLSAAAQALAHGYPAWLGARFLVTTTLAGFYVVATGIVVALFPPQVRGKLIALNSALFPSSNILLGVLGGALGDAHWRWLLWLGAAPLLLAPLLYILIPDGRRFQGHDGDDSNSDSPGKWREMFAPPWRWLTLGCVLLSGIDFNAYQLFLGFVTVYLKQVQTMPAAAMGATVALISTGSLIGNFVWAVASDRFGRRSTLIGYVVAAVAILIFLYGDLGLTGQRVAGFVYGFGLSCTAAWGAWFAEMFPPRLRPHGASLFHAGHVLAFGAPLFAAYASAEFGLTAAMATASLLYVLGAVVWGLLPETVARRGAALRT